MRLFFIDHPGMNYNTDTMLTNTVSISVTTVTLISTWLSFHCVFLFIFPSLFIFNNISEGHLMYTINITILNKYTEGEI